MEKKMISLDLIVKIGRHLLKWFTAIEDVKKKDKEIKRLRARLRKMEKLYLENKQ